jgi:tetratricopeptide (TPR) repeat protein
VKDYAKAIELDNKKVEYYIWSGNLKNQLGNNLGALSDYARATELEPSLLTRYIRLEINQIV